jgi:uncharacterized membrane protein
MENKRSKSRIWELDFFRGIALICMVYFHVIYDMKDIFGYNVDYSSSINYLSGKAAVILFTLISGISCFLSRSNLKRGLKILGLAAVITLATHLYGPEYGIKFGVLHFLGTCILLYPLFRRINAYLLLLLGAASIAFGNYISAIQMPHDYFFIIGLTSGSFISSDYYPLFPWIGVFLFGIALGKFFYARKSSIFKFSLGDNPISFLGRHTLLIYMLHQPVILAVLYAVKGLS